MTSKKTIIIIVSVVLSLVILGGIATGILLSKKLKKYKTYSIVSEQNLMDYYDPRLIFTLFTDRGKAPHTEDEISTHTLYSQDHSFVRQLKLHAIKKYYDEDFKLSADWCFIMYVRYKLAAQFKHLNFPIAFYDNTGMSSTIAPEILKAEYKNIIQYVFNDFAPLIYYYQRLEKDYKNSIWYDITHKWGTGKLLIFLLRVYRFFVRRLVRKNQK